MIVYTLGSSSAAVTNLSPCGLSASGGSAAHSATPSIMLIRLVLSPAELAVDGLVGLGVCSREGTMVEEHSVSMLAVSASLLMEKGAAIPSMNGRFPVTPVSTP